ncbi:hypothetical protein AVEN_239349-1 [Araneus ventricosus]|uniref:Integrase catalytic domain-containing protein n=1 Tax=Araneus ventricosus TaxID=182803 RepID=A0A4Y2EE51_ARAVE|nr:hypothetical protein AVEN_239349-1 [Araneus ventricosus]
MEIREEQLKDEDLRKVNHCFKNDDKDVNHVNWLERGCNLPNNCKTLFLDRYEKVHNQLCQNCLDCSRFKASNHNPAGFLQTPVQAQRFETIAIDLFSPLPESKDKKKWIFIVEDVATRWIELFALPNATARECATVLMKEVFLRFELLIRVISDNDTQFVSAVMQ